MLVEKLMQANPITVGPDDSFYHAMTLIRQQGFRHLPVVEFGQLVGIVTDRDLRQAVERGAFRKDLYYRLQVVTVTMPPLRTRRQDIPLLAAHFLEHFGREFKKRPPRLSAEAERLLVQYEWPGNVRELRNVIERAMILEETLELLPADLPPELGRPSVSVVLPMPQFRLPETGVVLEEVEREFVRQALEQTLGNQTRAARLLGLTRDELRYRAKKFEISHRTEGEG